MEARGRIDPRLRPPRSVPSRIPQRAAVLLLALACGRRHGPELERAERLLADARGQSQAGFFERAVPVAEQAVKILETERGPHAPETLSALVQLGRAYLDAGELVKAREVLERSLLERERLSRRATREAAESACAVGTVLVAKGDWASARGYLDRGMSAYEQTLGPDAPETAVCRVELSQVLAQQGDAQGARSGLDRAVLALERAGAAQKNALYGPALGRAIERLAALDQKQGDLARARERRERAVEIVIGAVGPEHPRVAELSLGVAAMYADAGELVQAREAFERAVAVRESRLGPDALPTAEARGALGEFLAAQGDRPRARAVLDQAVATTEKRLGAQHPKTLSARAALARVTGDGGDLQTGTRLLEQVIADEVKVLGDSDPTLAGRYLLLAEWKQRTGKPEDALALVRKALAIDRRLEPRGPLAARDLERLGALYFERGQLRDARRELEQALAIKERLYGSDHLLTASALAALGGAEAGLGEGDKATDHLLRAQAIERWIVTLLRSVPVAGRRTAVFRELRSAALSQAAVYASDSLAPWVALYTSARWKGLELALSGGDRTAAAAGPSAAMRQAFADLAKLRAEAAELVTSPAPLDPTRQTLLRRLRSEEQRIAGKLGQERLRAIGDPVDDPTAQAICEALPADAVLIDYVVTAGKLFATVTRQRECRVAFVDLGALDPVKETVKALRKRVDDDAADLAKGASPVGREALTYFHSRRLRALVLQPLVKAVGEVRTLYVSPAGPLVAVPFGLLSGSHRRYLIEELPIVHLQAPRDLVRPEGQPGRDVLLLGDVEPAGKTGGEGGPTWPATSACAKLGGTVWPAMPEAKKELEALASLHGKAARIARGADATEAELRRLAPGRRLVHLALQGYFVSEKCLPPTSERGSLSSDDEGEVLKVNPLLFSGLALSGAGGPSGGGDDGYATALELSALDLRGTALVVVSGTDTGAEGETERGVGIAALERAFLDAGALRVTHTLWANGAPESTRIAIHLHEALAQGARPAEALRRAQLAVMTEAKKRGRIHPLFWGGWLQVGD